MGFTLNTLSSGFISSICVSRSFTIRDGKGTVLSLIPLPFLTIRAFSLIRAELGNNTVQSASLIDEYPPEARYEWKNLDKPVRPKINVLQFQNPSKRKIVRRVFKNPVPLSHVKRRILVPVLKKKDVKRSSRRKGASSWIGGPFHLQGRWWEKGYDRDYYFIETDDGRILWIYYERSQGNWLVQGWVE